jgi:phosphopantothenoylcysteine decarboxylase/phosphopantothenate--cysteine ligase
MLLNVDHKVTGFLVNSHSLMSTLSNKRILLGITGGIAAYKAAELVRGLRQAGAEVRVVMTRAATAFITPMTLQALSGHPVRSELFDPQHEAAMGHIELARWADIILVAPASADFIARLATGMADDLLATLCLATTAPIAVAPAMNQQMWAAPATVENAGRLRQRGIRIFGPAEGEQACGEHGPGRMLEPSELLEQLAAGFATSELEGVRVTVTAGPTREAIDPVRFLSNRSSGRMGFAIATAAAEAGARVRLVAGPVGLVTPPGVERINVETAAQMLDAVLADPGEIFIACAAVADYRPVTAAQNKIKKDSEHLELSLQRNPDILATVSALSEAPFTVGFAAETDNLEGHARAKLESKDLDMIAANWVGERALGGGFDSDTNALALYWPGGEKELPNSSKQVLARRLIAVVAERFKQQ